MYEVPDPTTIAVSADLTLPAFGLTLTLHVAALVAVDAHTLGLLPPAEPDRLTKYLLDREEQHWERLYENRTRGLDHQMPPSTMKRTVFTAALTGSLPHPEAAALISSVESELPNERILTDHSRCYPPADPERNTVLEPLYPDRLAEDFLALALPGGRAGHAWAPTRLRAVLEHRPRSARQRWWRRRASVAAPEPTYLGRAMTFLIAAAARWPHLREGYVYPLLREQPQLAVTAGSATIATLSEIPDVDPAVCAAVYRVIPKPRSTHGDFDTAVAAIYSPLVRHLLTTVNDPAVHAELHYQHAVYLSRAGRWKEAVVPAEEATAILRRLAATDPPRFGPFLAKALHSLSSRRAELGDLRESLSLIEEAVAIGRQTAETDPAARLPDLAAMLTDLGIRLSELGQYERALSLTEEALVIRRRLAEGEPTGPLSDLANSLQNMSTRKAESGQWAQALPLLEEAVAIRRRLAETDPAAYQPDLALSLVNLSIVLPQVSQPEKAMAVAEEALTLYRRLAKINPVHLPRLASAEDGLGIRLAKAGRLEEALARFEEAVMLYRRLADRTAAYVPDLANALHNLALHLSRMAQPELALAPAMEAVALCRQLARIAPAKYRSNLVTSLVALFNRLAELERWQEALSPTEEAVAVLRQLADENPAAREGDLAAALSNFAKVRAIGKVELDDGLAAATAAMDILERLKQRDPEKYGRRAAIAGAQAATILETLDRPREAEAIRRRFAEPPA